MQTSFSRYFETKLNKLNLRCKKLQFISDMENSSTKRSKNGRLVTMQVISDLKHKFSSKIFVKKGSDKLINSGIFVIVKISKSVNFEEEF